MADNGGGNAFLGFVLGGVVVVLALIAFVVYGGNLGGGKTQLNVELPSPSAPTTR
jgi:hypothetical protein